jgi:hypothetical protein
MKQLMRDRRRRLPALAVTTALVLTFGVPPLSRLVAQSSSSSLSSGSSTPSCDSSASFGSAAPGQTVAGNLSSPCVFSGPVTVKLNNGSLTKNPDANGKVHVSVKVTSTTKGVLDDPVDVTLHCGTNTVTATGNTQADVTATASGTFTVVCAVALVPPRPLTPVTTPGTTGGRGLARTGMNILALLLLAGVAIAIGLFTIASERAIPVAATAAPVPEPVPTLAVPTLAIPTLAIPTLAIPTLSLEGRWRGAARLARQFRRYG